MFMYVVGNTVELVYRLGGLGIEIYVAGEVQLLYVVELLYYYGMTLRLTYQSQHLGMTILAEDNNLRVWQALILSLYAALKLEHHRAGGIYYLDVIVVCQAVCGRRFAMSTKQYGGIMKLAHFFMIDGGESHTLQPFTLHTVMNNITQAIELCTLCQFFFCLFYGSGNTKAETAAAIYFYL